MRFRWAVMFYWSSTRGRLFRNGKARMSIGVKDVLERLGSNQEFWYERIKKFSKPTSCVAAFLQPSLNPSRQLRKNGACERQTAVHSDAWRVGKRH
jgi:hypothetical protein